MPNHPNRARLIIGDRVVIVGGHPLATEAGTLKEYEPYGLGWVGWRVALDRGGSCYATPAELRRTGKADE